jgi:hypothetical protein
MGAQAFCLHGGARETGRQDARALTGNSISPRTLSTCEGNRQAGCLRCQAVQVSLLPGPR